MVRENFVANLQSFTGKVMSQEKDGYKAEVQAAQKAAEPILQKMDEDLNVAYLRLQEKAQAASETAEATTETEKAPVAA